MPKVTGIFEEFKDFEKIPLENIAKWLKPYPNPIALQNFYANRVYYPQVIPVTKEELNFDLAILRELLINNLDYLNTNNKKITIPERFLVRFPDLYGLTMAFADAYIYSQDGSPYGLWTVIAKYQTKEEKLASVLVPQFENTTGSLSFNIDGKKLNIRAGDFLNIKSKVDKCRIIYQINAGTFLGKKEGMVEVYSGKVGILLDGRRYG